MPSLDERREVAARLRECIGLHEFAEVFGFSWTDESDWYWRDVTAKVADYVEPEPERTCRVERMEIDEFGRYFYLSCGHMQMTHNTSALPYCPDCGAEVVEA